MAQRVVLGLLAVAVLAWLGVLLRDHVIMKQASPLLYKAELTPAEFELNLQRLKDAEFLNPDRSLAVGRATYLVTRGRWRAGAGIAEQVVREEPANVAAWVAILNASQGRDPARARRAAAAIERLNPRAGSP